MQAHVAGRQRRHLDLHEGCSARVPGLLLCGHSRTTHAVGEELWAGLQAHSHPCWEVHWIAAGAVEWWAGDQPAADLGAHWCQVVPPGLRHGSATGMLEPCEVWWMQLDPARLAGVPARHRAQIERGLRALPRAFPAGDLGPDWAGLGAALAQAAGQPAGSLPAFLAQTRLAQLLTRILLEQHRLSASPLAGLAARAGDPGAGIAALARAAGCSPSSLHRRFRQDLGISPAAWLRRQRLNRAKQLLRAGDQDIVAIARGLRFASSQQFATQFRQLTGITPSDYRRRTRALAR
jgi:AraC-like DNA-binding protein